MVYRLVAPPVGLGLMISHAVTRRGSGTNPMFESLESAMIPTVMGYRVVRCFRTDIL